MTTRENGWYWVFRRSDYHPDPFWSVMLWDGDCWLVSGIEWPSYEDSDMIKIKPERLKAPEEQ